MEEAPKRNYSRLGKRMLSIMRASGGVGLAASQIDLDEKVFVYTFLRNDHIVVEPEMLEMSDEQTEALEACLSLPGEEYLIKRSKVIKVQYTNGRNGRKLVRELVGTEARIFQHEYDHLEGLTIRDRREKGN